MAHAVAPGARGWRFHRGVVLARWSQSCSLVSARVRGLIGRVPHDQAPGVPDRLMSIGRVPGCLIVRDATA